MAAITISRQYGSGGSEVARRVAQALGWTLIDNEFVDRVAERAGLPREQVAEQEEKVPSLVDRLASALALTSPEAVLAGGDAQAVLTPEAEGGLVKVTEAVIAEAVAQGDVVLVGRGAQAYLGERTDALHVFVAAPRGVRVERAMERLSVDHREAERVVDETDAHRARYAKTHYARAWGEATHYHLLVNTALLGVEGAATLVVASARLQFGLPAPVG